jgi:primosomal protein N' (replication factor Y)
MSLLTDAQFPPSPDVPHAPLPYALVVPDRAQSSVMNELTYGLPDSLQAQVQVGSAVLVPVGKQQVTGYVTGFTQTLDFDPKSLRLVLRLLSREPLFDEIALLVARWMSAYYHAPLAECLCLWVPQGSQQSGEKWFRFSAPSTEFALRALARSPRAWRIAQLLMQSDKPLSTRQIVAQSGINDASELLRRLLEQGIVNEEEVVSRAAMKPRVVQAGACSARRGSSTRRSCLASSGKALA